MSVFDNGEELNVRTSEIRPKARLSGLIISIIVISYSTDVLDGLINLGFMYLTPFRVSFLFILAMLLASILIRKGMALLIPKPNGQLIIVGGVFVIVLLISGLVNGAFADSIKKALFVAFLLFFSIVLSLVLNALYGSSRWSQVIRSFEFATVGVAVVLVSVGLYQEVTNAVWWGDREYRSWIIPPHLRITSLFYDPNFYGMSLIMPFFINLSVVYTGDKLSDYIIRTLLSLYILLGMNMSGSQGGVIAILSGLVYMRLAKSRVVRKRLWWFGIVLGGLGSGIVINVKNAVLLISNIPYLATLIPRFLSWYAGLFSFLKSPLFGIGPGHYERLNKSAITGEIFAFKNPNALDNLAAHSVFIEILVEGGAISFFLFLAYHFIIFAKAEEIAVKYKRLQYMPSAIVAIAIASLTLSYYPASLYTTYGILLYLFSSSQYTKINTRKILRQR